MNTAEIIAIVLGSLSGVLLLVFLYFYFRNRTKVSSRNPDMSQGTSRQGMNLMNEIDRLTEENRRLRNYGSDTLPEEGYGHNSIERPDDMSGTIPPIPPIHPYSQDNDIGYPDYGRDSPSPLLF